MANVPNDPAQLLASLLEGGQAMMRNFGVPSAPEPGASNPMADFFAASQQVANMQQEFWKQATAYWSAFPAAFTGAAQAPADAADSDRRFAAEAWRNDPRFDLIRRSYLAYSSFLENTVESAQLDEKTKARCAMACGNHRRHEPIEFPPTNPEAMQLAAETGEEPDGGHEPVLRRHGEGPGQQHR
jgi:polyhydroxyalkanoate synthase